MNKSIRCKELRVFAEEIRVKTLQTFAHIGFGHIGGQVARLFQAFGARVVTASRSRREEMAALGIPYVTLPELLQMSDIISETMAKAAFIAKPTYEDYVATNLEARKIANSFIR